MQSMTNEWLLPSVSRCLGIPPASTAAPATSTPPGPALPNFSSVKELTYGDETNWKRWCSDFFDFAEQKTGDKHGFLEQRCKTDRLREIQLHILLRGWTKSCAIRYEYLDFLSQKPDPYMCE